MLALSQPVSLSLEEKARPGRSLLLDNSGSPHACAVMSLSSSSVSQSVRVFGASVSRVQYLIIKVTLICNGEHPEAVPVFPWSSASHSDFSRRLEKAFASQLVGICQEGP